MAKEETKGMDMFMPDSHDIVDGAKIVPPQVETSVKSSPVEYPSMKERMHATKPWKPKGRK